MPLNTDALKNSVNGHSASRPKRPTPNQERQQEQLDDINAHSRQTISALAQSGVNTINTRGRAEIRVILCHEAQKRLSYRDFRQQLIACY